MSTSPRQTINALQKEIGGGVNSVMDEFYTALKTNTPVNTGRARAGWKRFRKVNIGRGETQNVFANTVPYIDRLNEGWSKQAPNGIVDPAWEQANKKG
jgi:hypothetical protein